MGPGPARNEPALAACRGQWHEHAATVWKAIYESPWHNPGFFWVVTIAFLVVLVRAPFGAEVRRPPWLVAFLTLFAVETLADALLLGELSPLSRLGPDMASYVTIGVVILGDFRYFLLVERFVRGSAKGAAWAVALALAFLVPIAIQILRVTMPETFGVPRHVFLAYESLFLTLALALRFVVLPRRLRGASEVVRRWILGVTTYVAVYYGLWALADIVILRGVDAGFGLRLVPNALYYAFFLPFVWRTAPPEVLS